MSNTTVPSEQLQQIIKRIKSRGYWRVNFRPSSLENDKISSVLKCKEMVERSVVGLRGSDFPCIPTSDTEAERGRGQNYAEAFVDCQSSKEVWRMYKSCQFVHFFSVREDWIEEISWPNEEITTAETNHILGVVETIHTLTEIYEFLSHLTEKGIYKEGLDVEIGLYNARNKSRELKILDPRRVPLLKEYVATTRKISFSKHYSEKEILHQGKSLALEMILDIFSGFSWEDPPLETIMSDQRAFLAGKM